MGNFSIEISGVGDGVTLNEQSLQAFRYEETSHGAASYLIHARVKDDKAWQAVLFDPERTFKLRMKWLDTKGSSASPLKTLRHGLSALIHPGQGPEIKLRGFCAGGDLLHDFVPSAYYKGQKISEMVEAIAERAALKAEVLKTRGIYTLYQCTYPSGYFIKHFLLPRAASETRSDYQFWIKDGSSLVFRPPDVASIRARFVVPPTPTQAGDARVDHHEFHLDDDALSILGSLSTGVRSWDPLERQFVGFVADEKSVKYPQLAPKAPDPPRNPTRVFLVPHMGPPDYDPAKVTDMGSAQFCQNLRAIYGVSLAFVGMLSLHPGDVFQVDTDHPLGGRYLVSRIVHTWDEQTPKLITILTGERRTHQ